VGGRKTGPAARAATAERRVAVVQQTGRGSTDPGRSSGRGRPGRTSRAAQGDRNIGIVAVLTSTGGWRLKLTGKIGIGIGKRKENPAPGNLPGQGKFLDEIRVLSREISSSNLKQRMSIGKFSWWEMASTE